MLNLFSLVLVLLLSLVGPSVAQNIFFQGRAHANNSLILIEDIGEDTLSISCRTTLFGCCKQTVRGEWYYPNGRQVPRSSTRENFYRNRDDAGNVKLHRRNNALGPRGAFYCILPDNRGVPVRLSVIVYSNEDYPVVTAHPQPQLNVDPRSNVSFAVMANGSSNYHWRRNNLLLSSNPLKYTGTRHSVLTIFGVTKADEGSYSCTVGNSILSVLSNDAQLTLLSPPVILVEPESVLDVDTGSTIMLSVDVEGFRLTFSWQRTDNRTLAGDPRFEGTTTSSLTLHRAQAADSGEYVCEVSNAAGTVRSREARISVRSVVDIVESISISTDITSARVSWVSPNVSPSTSYELQYFPVLFPSHSVTINTTLKFHDVIGLIPTLRYQFQVRIHSNQNLGKWVSEVVTLDKRIPSPRNISLATINGVSVVVSWLPPPELPGWNISYYYLTYRTYDKERDRAVTTLTRTVGEGCTSETVNVNKVLESEEVVHVFEVVAALRIEGLEGIGEVKGEAAAFNTSLKTEEMPFQMMLGPVPYCVNWEVGKSDSIEATLKKALLEGIRTHCNCSLETSPIGRGIFSCRGRENIVTYRSTVRSLNSTEMLGYIQDWVSTNVTLLHDWYLVDIYSSCPVKVSRLEEPECRLP